MKLLLDQYPSDRIPAKVADLFPRSTQVNTVGLDTADDDRQDGDFLARALTLGQLPQFIHGDLGNCSPARIVSALCTAHPVIQQFVAEQRESVLTFIR